METVSAVQTKDYIVSAIRSEILAGNMRPGEELTQEMIAEQLGCRACRSGKRFSLWRRKA